MGFEVFERRRWKTSAAPRCGINSRGNISLNASAYKLLMSTAEGKAPKEIFVEMLFDRQREIVGMRLSGSENSYALRKQAGSESYIVAPTAFWLFHKLPVGKVRHFTPQIYDGKIVGFSLKAGGE